MFSNGVALLPNQRYSATIKVEDINYQIANDEKREDIFSYWMQLLNSLTPEEGMDITIHNHSLDEEQYRDDVLIKYREDDCDKYREEINHMLINGMKTGSNNIISDKYISFAIKEETLDDAYRELSTIQKELVRKLKTLGCLFPEQRLMSGAERLELLYHIMQPKKKLYFDYEHLDGLTTKDAIAPDGVHFENRASFKIEDRFCKVLFLKNYSTELCDAFLSDLSKLQYNFTINIHLKIIDQAEALQLVMRQKATIEKDKTKEEQKAYKNGYSPEMIPEETKYSYKEARALLEDIKTRNQRLFSCQFVMLLNCASEEELAELEKRATNVAKKHNLNLGGIYYIQEAGLQSVLPLCFSRLPIERILTTSATASFIPFTSMELNHRTKNSIYYGINGISGNLLRCDRTLLLNPTGWIFGKPGSGKSFKCKEEMLMFLLMNPNIDVIVIDPEMEYVHLARLKGIDGTVVELSNTSGNYLNPLDGEMEDKDFLASKVEFCQAMTACIVGDRQMTPGVISLVDRCARYVYGRYSEQVTQAKQNDEKRVPKVPTFTDFYHEMKKIDDTEAKAIAKAMEIYVEGTNNFFAKQSNVDIKNRYTVYVTRDLPTSMKPLAMLVVLESLWQRMVYNFYHGKVTYIYIDEITTLFSSSYCLDFFSILWKRARKYNAVLTGITQNPEELLSNMATRTMVSNSEFVLMMNQSASDRECLQELFNISEDQMAFIANGEEGSGLLYNGKAIIPFTDNFPKNTELYRAMTTKPDERNRIDHG